MLGSTSTHEERPRASTPPALAQALPSCRKKPRTGKYSAFINIPTDIIFNMLLLIPARDLIESVRFVCKEWNDIISDPSFVSAHFRRLSSSPGNVGLIVQDEFGNDANLKRAFHIEPDKAASLYRVTEIELPIPATIADSCNGLVLLHSHRDPGVLVVVNLVTKSKISLPPIRGVIIINRPALAYAPCSGQYKVVYVSMPFSRNKKPSSSAMAYYNHIYTPIGSEAEIYVCTVGLDETWRNIDSKNVTQRFTGRGAPFSVPPVSNGGSIYWFNHHCYKHDFVLDVETEMVYPFSGPKRNKMDYREIIIYGIKLDTGGVGVVNHEYNDNNGSLVWKVWEVIEELESKSKLKSKSNLKSWSWGRVVEVDNYDMSLCISESLNLLPVRPIFLSFEKHELLVSCAGGGQHALVCYNYKTMSSSFVARNRPAYDLSYLHMNTLLSL